MSGVGFEAVVQSARGGGHFVEVDRSLADGIGAKHMTRVRGTLAATGRDTGDTVAITTSIDGEPRERDR